MNLQFLVKMFVTSLIIVSATEVSKRSSYFAAVLISLPTMSIISLSWLYVETKDIVQITKLSNEILWLVVPSLLFFVFLSRLLNGGLNYWIALAASSGGTAAAYYFYTILLRRFGIGV
jgi:hypothetical protein